MPCITCGLDNKTCEEWGYPRLVTEKTEWLYCGCDCCEGHRGEPVALSPEDWYWEPQRRRVDMSDLFKLECKPGLSKVLGCEYEIDKAVREGVDD